MADIFVSYAKEDIERVRPLVEILEGQGWSVAWDHNLPTAETHREGIHDEVRSAQCIIVVWTATSVNRPQVLAEAEEAEFAGLLIPVFMERVDAPLGFASVEGFWLGDWTGDPDDVDLLAFCWKVERLLKPERRGGPGCHIGPSKPWWRAWWRGPSW